MVFRGQLEYKQVSRGGVVVLGPSMYSRQQCPECLSISAEIRQTQNRFQCVTYGDGNHAD
ncbi:MAG: zinc ribbon domain-containing protein [Nitrospiria bacterium]